MVRTEMVPHQDANPAEVEEHLEPELVLITLEIVNVEGPMPGDAGHGRLANEDRKQASARKPSGKEVSAVRQIGAGKTSTATA
jgi:hypothetical protein